MNAKEARENARDFYYKIIDEDAELKKRLEEINGIIVEYSKNGLIDAHIESNAVPAVIVNYLELSGFEVFYTDDKILVIMWGD